MDLSHAETIFKLMPEQIIEQCKNEYATLSVRCMNERNFVYQGVRITTSQKAGKVSVSFYYDGVTISVNNTSWERLDSIFRRH